MREGTYFHLQDFYLAAFLFAKGMELVSVNKITNPKRATFVFLDSPDREDLVQGFSFGKEDDPTAMVDARKFIAAIRGLKEKLYRDNI